VARGGTRQKGQIRLRRYLPDLEQPQPPDVPPGMVKLRLIKKDMRKNAVRAVIATCQVCGHKADVNVDALPEIDRGSRDRTTALMRPMRRQADRYETRMAYGVMSGASPKPLS